MSTPINGGVTAARSKIGHRRTPTQDERVVLVGGPPRTAEHTGELCLYTLRRADRQWGQQNAEEAVIDGCDVIEFGPVGRLG